MTWEYATFVLYTFKRSAAATQEWNRRFTT